MMSGEIDTKKIVTHDFPVWREKSNFIIAVHITELDITDLVEWEQIWARQISERLFEICCIPFFAYQLALGDQVETKSANGRKYVINRIVSASGHTTYRIWFLDIGEWDFVVHEIRRMGGLVEFRWTKSTLIAADAPSREVKEKLEIFLRKLETAQKIKCEISI